MKKLFFIPLLIIFLGGCTQLSEVSQNKIEEQSQSNLTEEIEEELDYESSLVGEWVSLDDPKSVIGFIDGKKIDYYDGELISQGEFELSENNLIVIDDATNDSFGYEILELDNDSLIMIYQGRGNVLRYTSL